MDKKEISKKYLISAAGLYFIGAAVIALVVFALCRLADNPVPFGVRAALAFLLPLIPLGSYTGFVISGLKIKEFKTGHAVLLIVFYPFVLAFVTVFGIIMIIPKIISSTIDVIRG